MTLRLRSNMGRTIGRTAWMTMLALSMGAVAACDDDDDPGPATARADGGPLGGSAGRPDAGAGGTGGVPAPDMAGGAADAAPADAAPAADIVATAQAAGSFNTLVAALTAAGLVDVLKGPGPFTVLAPTDAAFAKLPAGTVQTLLQPENKPQLEAILKYHVLAGAVPASQVVTLTTATTLEGRNVAIAVDGATVKVNDATVTMTDIQASNGIIHVIDTVLIPPTVVTTAQAAGFTSLVTALQAAELVETLSGPGPFTVFAPTDAAFAKVPAAVVTELLKPESKPRLQEILKYHVVAGRVPASEVVTLTSVPTLEGRPLSISVMGSTVKVNESTVTMTDVEGGNGVIHAIDTVLLPPM